MYKYKVDIIPGHGGFDPGACGSKGIRECDGTLAVALKLAYLLNINGIKSNLSRNTNIACGGAKNTKQDVNNQIAFSNNSNADIAISIHFNSAVNKTAHGVESLYSQYNGLLNNNIKLAELLVNEVVNATGLTNRGSKNVGKSIGVVRAIKKPVSLIECAFISNPDEEIWVYDDAHQLVLAKAICKAICKYFGVEYKEHGGDEEDLLEAKVKIDDRQLNAYLINNKTFVELRSFCDSINRSIEWDNNTSTATVSKENFPKVNIEVENTKINGILIEDKTFGSLREIAEVLGKKVEWVNDTKTAIVK